MSLNKTISRKELYDWVWSVPMGKISEDLGFKANQLKRLCEKYNIPVPENGYWSKLKFNKSVQKFSLKGNPDEKLDLSEALEQSPYQKILEEIMTDKKAPVKVPAKLSNPDILTINTINYWKDKKNKDIDENKSLILPVYVEEENKKRALRFMDALVKLLRYRGFSFEKKYFQTRMVLDGIELPLYLREHNKRVLNKESNYPSYNYMPTGNFILKTGEYSQEKEWAETPNVRIEEKLVHIVAWAELKVREEKEWRERRRIAEEIRKKEEQIQQEIEAKKRAEAEKLNILLLDAEKHHQANLVRKYIGAVESNAISQNTLNEELSEWLLWAHSKADEIDPLKKNKK